MMTTIMIKRSKLTRPGRTFGHQPWVWAYEYTTPVNIDWPHYTDGKPNGESHPGPRAGEYVGWGRGLAELHEMLRRKFGKDVQIIESWKR
jgi:hypothetical protein